VRVGAAASLVGLGEVKGWGGFAAKDAGFALVAAQDRARILKAADEYVGAQPVTVTAARSERSQGGVHDYFSEGDYWWPDAKNPGGPYVRRDGYSNPANFNAHREAMIRLSLMVPTLAAAWVLTKKKRYADAAGVHLRAWFVDAATKMNPNLEYAQAIFGVTKGRGIGIIDTLHLVEVARAATVLDRGGVLEGGADVRGWFAEYLEWMRSSKNGQEERDAKNNHGTCWVLQAGEFARFTGNDAVMKWCEERFRTVLVPGQIAPDGSLPLELARTKPYSYSLFDMDVLCGIAQSLTPDARVAGSLWEFAAPDGRGLRKMMAWIEPFVADKAKWPYKHDVEHWEDFPVRNPALLFAGLAYGERGYIDVWKRLNADPKVPEVVRNFPIRQPILWV